MRRFIAIPLLVALAPAAGAMDVGKANAVFVSAPMADGFAAISISAFGDARCGLMCGQGLYLRFIADTATVHAERQAVPLAEIKGEVPPRAVSNIPVV